MVGVPTLAGRRHLAAPLLAALLAAGHLMVPTSTVVAQAQPTDYYPTLYVTPECLTGPETSVHVHGRNFQRNAAVEVWDLYQYHDWAYGNHVDTTTSNFGTFDVDLSIHEHAPAEFHRIVAPYANTFVEQAPLIVNLCDARITVEPHCRTGGGPTDVRVTGSGFVYPGPSIHFELYHIDDLQSPLESMYTDYTGPFDVDFGFPDYPNGLPNGQYRVRVSQQSSDPPWYVFADAFVVVPCPTVSLQPVCASAGSPPDQWSIEVTTAGWIESSLDWINYVEIVFDPNGQPQEFTTWASNGTAVITPFRRPAGTYTVLVKQGYFAGSYSNLDSGPGTYPAWTGRQFESVTKTLSVPCPATPSPSPTPTPSPSPTPSLKTSIAADPSCGAPQLEGDVPISDFVAVTGTGFKPGALTLTFDPGGPNEQVFGASALEDGTFEAQIPIRAGPAGTFKIVAHQDAVGAFVADAEVVFNVPCAAPSPLLTLDPPCGVAAAGVAIGYLVSITGSGFLPGRVDITFDASSLAPVPMPPATAAADGSFTALIAPPGRAPGTYTIAAHQQVAGSSLAVDATAEFDVACEGPNFQLVPANGSPGLVVLVVGHGFPPNVDLLLLWSVGINASRPTVVHTDANGDFTRQILIFNSDFAGPRQMTIQSPTDPQALTGLIPADFMVTTGTVSPPFSLVGNPYAGPYATIVLRH